MENENMINDNIVEIYKLIYFVKSKYHLKVNQDEIQEIAMYCYNKLKYFDNTRGKFSTYVIKCIYNKFLMLKREQKALKNLKLEYGLDFSIFESPFEIENLAGKDYAYFHSYLDKVEKEKEQKQIDKKNAFILDTLIDNKEKYKTIYNYFVLEKTQYQIAQEVHNKQSCVSRKLRKELKDFRNDLEIKYF